MESTAENLIFDAPTTLKTVEQILFCIEKNLPFFPQSPKEPLKRNLTLPKSGVLIQTSGSSGTPKMAHLLLNHLFNSAKFCHQDLTLTDNNHLLLSVPIYHVSGLSIIIRSFLSKAKIILPGDSNEKLATHISFVPTSLKRFLKNPKSYPNLKAILVGGAPIPLDLCKEAYNRGFPIFITYGLTEMSSQVCTKRFCLKEGITFGFPLKGREVKIVNDEIYVRGETLFQGYLDAPSPFIEGWFPTKDLGKIGPFGLEVLGRKDHLFISGGENIQPEEIEIALLSHPNIFRAKVTSRKDLEFGQRPFAYIQTDLTAKKIILYLMEKIAKYKIPYEKDIVINPENFPWKK